MWPRVEEQKNLLSILKICPLEQEVGKIQRLPGTVKGAGVSFWFLTVIGLRFLFHPCRAAAVGLKCPLHLVSWGHLGPNMFLYNCQTFWTSFCRNSQNGKFMFAHVWNVQFDEQSTPIGDKWHSKSMTVGSKNRAFKKNALYFCQFMQSIELKTW